MKTVATDRLLAGTRLDDEITLESSAVRAGIARYHRLAQVAVERGDGASLKPAERLVLHWLQPLAESIKTEKRQIRMGRMNKGRGLYGPSLLWLTANRIAVVTLHHMLGQCLLNPLGVTVAGLSYGIGRAIVAELNYDLLRLHDRGKSREDKLLRQLDRRCRNLNPLKVNWFAKKSLTDAVFGKKLCHHLGCAMIWHAVGACSAEDYDEPFRLAFLHERRWQNTKSVAFVRLADEVYDVIERGHSYRQYLRPRYMPMIVSPYPWGPDADGGYIRVRTPLTSKATPDQKAALARAKLDRVHAGLNAISATPWQINERMLDLVTHYWDTGGNVTGIPMADDLPMPERPADIDINDDVKKAWKKEASAIHRGRVHQRAERVQFLQRLHVAEEMRPRREFYFPHQLDFRSRAYPVPPHLHHQGDDLARGLLQSARDNQLNERGTYWLHVHTANCWGIDKVPFDARVQWVKDNAATIRHCATNPIEFTQWREADKPWQFLAACNALIDPKPAAHLFVQMDGTCNGLQHYAAIGRDEVGAVSVNLLPSDCPADVYTDVTEVVAELVEQAQAEGNEFAAIVANLLSRKVCKQPVMTTVYGVTPQGARDQIISKLGAITDERQRYQCAKYLANTTLAAMAEKCTAAIQIMDWLQDCARLISDGNDGELVRWTSPLGFPVVQPYRHWARKRIRTVLQSLQIMVNTTDVPVASGKQIDGVAPNWIHSVDASHMLMTAITCAEAGIDYAAVHDSFWAHANNIDQLHAILRDEFINLHRQPLLSKLRASWVRRHPRITFPPTPPQGSLDLELVRHSPYLFS